MDHPGSVFGLNEGYVIDPAGSTRLLHDANPRQTRPWLRISDIGGRTAVHQRYSLVWFLAQSAPIPRQAPSRLLARTRETGGGEGIRTPGSIPTTAVFKAQAIECMGVQTGARTIVGDDITEVLTAVSMHLSATAVHERASAPRAPQERQAPHHHPN